MPTVTIQKQELAYDEADVITFEEGLIGLPSLRRMVLVKQPGIEPFLWLVSLDDPATAFVVADPRSLFGDYDAGRFFGHDTGRGAWDEFAAADAGPPLLLSVVVVAADWSESTINLRAPLVVCPRTMRGAQRVLSESAYKVDEPLPFARAA
jgi:flagellar assembly factor FliW